MNRYLTTTCIWLIGLLAFAQSNTYEEFKKQQMQQFNTFRDTKQAEYDAYRRALNDAYAQFMENSWEIFAAQHAVVPPQEQPVPPVLYEKQDTPPVNVHTQEQPADSTVVASDAILDFIPILFNKDVITLPEPAAQPEPIAPIEPQPTPHQLVSIAFYGTLVSIAFPMEDDLTISRVQEKELAKVWKKLSAAPYDITIKTALDARAQLKLCDWGYLQMLQAVCEKRYGKTNEAVFMQAYLMAQSGYQIRLAYNQSNLYCLVASTYNIISMSYFIVDGVRFYPLNCSNQQLSICKAAFDKEQKLSLQIQQEQQLDTDVTNTRKLVSRYGIEVEVPLDKNMVDFYDNYPSAYLGNDIYTRWAVYANTPLESTITSALYPTLRQSIDGLSERDAVNQLLNFVQTALQYEYDDKVWGGDRVFFAAETLYYPYADCEDRAILFSRLVRDLLGLDVVLLYYPGHLAAAVAFNHDVAGDYLMYGTTKYVVCDPTYIGAPVGRAMPGMNTQQAQVIVL